MFFKFHVYNYQVLKLISTAFVLLVIFAEPVAFASGDPTIVDVTDFGAIPNDDIDDTAAIQAAINAATDVKFKYLLDTYYLGTKTVVIPEGVFLVNGLVAYANNYLRIRGSGARSTVLKHHGIPGPVFHLKGTSYATIERLAIVGSSTASYGVLAEDIGYVEELKGEFPTVRGVLEEVEIRGVTGTPGIGFANTDRAHSWEFIRCRVSENIIGMKLIRGIQNTAIIRSSLIINQQQQLILGDGTNTLRSITIRDTNIEGTNVGSGELIRVDGVSPLTLDGVYFESHRNRDASDILAVNTPSNISIVGTYSNGGASTLPESMIKLATATKLSISSSSYINTTSVVAIVPAQGPKAVVNKPEYSNIILSNVTGPNIHNNLNIIQGGRSWDNGIRLTAGKQSWDLLADTNGVFWMGKNRKTMMAITPEGQLKPATP